MSEAYVNHCLCLPRRATTDIHERGCPEWIPITPAYEAWVRATREGDFDLCEFTGPDFGLKKRQYIWEMMRSKKNIGDKAKAKAKENFENAVCRYAAYIENGRMQAEQMKEYNDNLL